MSVQKSSNKHKEEHSIPVYTNLRNGDKRCDLLFSIYIFSFSNKCFKVFVLRCRAYRTNQP